MKQSLTRTVWYHGDIYVLGELKGKGSLMRKSEEEGVEWGVSCLNVWLVLSNQACLLQKHLRLYWEKLH